MIGAQSDSQNHPAANPNASATKSGDSSLSRNTAAQISDSSDIKVDDHEGETATQTLLEIEAKRELELAEATSGEEEED
jgi:hypothetical protein